ncbi:MAG: peptidoglycan-binding protein, partial [Blautia sp.]|nr:peptidoglycan-binding protein [Blautia sp.]
MKKKLSMVWCGAILALGLSLSTGAMELPEEPFSLPLGHEVGLVFAGAENAFAPEEVKGGLLLGMYPALPEQPEQGEGVVPRTGTSEDIALLLSQGVYSYVRCADVDAVLGEGTVDWASLPDAGVMLDIPLWQSSENAREVQRQLVFLGFLNGGIDGIFGNDSTNALKAFQESEGLPGDGICNVAVQLLLKLRSQDMPEDFGETTTVMEASTEVTSEGTTQVAAQETTVAEELEQTTEEESAEE